MARKISNLSAHIRDSDWLNFIHFSGYKYKIRLVSILRKREDHAFISITTILKFSAQETFITFYKKKETKTSIPLYILLMNIIKILQYSYQVGWIDFHLFSHESLECARKTLNSEK